MENQSKINAGSDIQGTINKVLGLEDKL